MHNQPSPLTRESWSPSAEGEDEDSRVDWLMKSRAPSQRPAHTTTWPWAQHTLSLRLEEPSCCPNTFLTL